MPYSRHPVDRTVVACGSESDVRLFVENENGPEQISHSLTTLTGHTDWINEIALSPDDKWIASASRDATVKVWSVEHEKCVQSLSHYIGSVVCVRFSFDGLRVVTGSGDSRIRVWEWHSGKCTLTLTGHTDPVLSVDFSPNGLKLVSGSPDESVRVWDSQSGECLLILTDHDSVVNAVRFSPDGTKVLSGSYDSTMKLFDSETGNCEVTFEGHSSTIVCVSFSFDGQTVLSGSCDNAIKIWSVGSGECLKTLTGHSSIVQCAVFSSDGKCVLSCSDDKTVREWNVHTGECTRTFRREHSEFVASIALSRIGNTFFTGSYDKSIKVWTRAKGTVRKLFPLSSSATEIVFSSDGNTLIVHCEDSTIQKWSIAEFINAYESAFRAAMQRGSVDTRSIKLLSLGRVLAGKTALLCALRGLPLPKEADRTLATRMERLRMVYDKGTGVFEAVPQEEHRLASLIGRRKEEQKKENESSVSTAQHSSTSSATVPTATPPLSPPASSSADHHATTTSISSSPSTTVLPPTAAPAAVDPSTMQTVLTLLDSQLREGHIDLETFDFAGEETFDSLPALFMGSESVYLIVFDLSAMDDAVTAQQQYEHITKWAHIIAHQVPSTDDAYFRVLLVGTHLDTFPNNTLPPTTRSLVSREIRRLVVALLGQHLMVPLGASQPFFAVGSEKRVGLDILSKALHDAVRERTLPLEYVCAQDLLGRSARRNEIALMSSASQLDGLVLSRDPVVTLSALLPDTTSVRMGLVPYLECAADVLVCRENATSQTLCDSDTIVFDIPRLISAVELLCSVVMARWGRATSERALAMLDLVTDAGNVMDETRTEKVLEQLDEAFERPEEGFPREVAEWLVWTAAAAQAKTSALLAGADVTDHAAFVSCLEHLSLLHQHGDRLLMPMLLPETAAFVKISHAAPAELFLYQMVYDKNKTEWEMLPVSVATFHLVVVALWRASLPGSLIQATQRSTNALTMDGCVPVRLRLNAKESFIRVELMLTDENTHLVDDTITKVCSEVCESTRTLRWGWRGSPVVVPAHPYNSARSLFKPCDVATASPPDHYRQGATVASELSRFSGRTRVCNVELETWWIPAAPLAVLPTYSDAAVLIVGVSRYAHTGGNPATQSIAQYPDLDGVRASVTQLQAMWTGRNCKVRTVTDALPGQKVTRLAIADALVKLEEDVGLSAGKNSLLIVHLLGHGVMDGEGGLILSDARLNASDRLSRLGMITLAGLVFDDAGWRGCNVLCVADFCNSGAMVAPEHDLMGVRTNTVLNGYARQVLTASLNDSFAYMSQDGSLTRLTELLLQALGPAKAVFRPGETAITAVELARRLLKLDSAKTKTFQSMLVGRIGVDWTRETNEGDILIFRDGNGVQTS